MAAQTGILCSFLLLLSSASASVSAIDFEYCRKCVYEYGKRPRHFCYNLGEDRFSEKGANYPVKVNGVEIIPDPIEREKPTKFIISASSSDEIYTGQVSISIKYFFIPVEDETINLCAETFCPVTIGDFILTHEQTLPSITPPGSYTLTMEITGENDKQLTCISFGFSIGFLASDVSWM